jgi:hypothetical protein
VVDDYSDIELSFSIDKNILLSADVYIKMNIIDKNKKLKPKEGQNVNEMSLYHYNYPGPDNYDYYMPSDETLGTISLNINDLPRLKPEEKSFKFIRGLVYISLKEENFDPIRPFGDGPIGDRPRWNNWPGHGRGPWNDNEANLPTITISLTPGVQFVKYVDASPHEYYFSNITYGSNMTKKPESKIYTLRVQNEDDDVLIIEISSCYGSYHSSITDVLENAGLPESDKDLDIFEIGKDGKKTFYITNLKSKTYYLTIRSKISDFLCYLRNKHFHPLNNPKESLKNNFTKECSNDLAYLMYYYSVKKKKYVHTN